MYKLLDNSEHSDKCNFNDLIKWNISNDDEEISDEDGVYNWGLLARLVTMLEEITKLIKWLIVIWPCD